MKLSEKLENMMEKMGMYLFLGSDFFCKIQDLSEKHLPKILGFIIFVIVGIIWQCSWVLRLAVYVQLYLPFYLIMKLIIGTIKDIEDKKLSFYSVGLLALLLISSLFVYKVIEGNAHPNDSAYNDSKYYICTGSYSEVYHRTSNCRGLNNCGREVISVSGDDYRVKNRRPCRICY